MRETPKHIGIATDTYKQEEQVRSGDITRNNLEKDKDMNLKGVKKEPVEVTESEEVKELNITGEETDALAVGLDKLNIKGEEDDMQVRGPTGGIPVSHGPLRMENKHIPVGPPLIPSYGNPQMYQQPPSYAAQHGRRMLDEPDEPPRQFRRPSPNFVPPQMQHFDVNNLNQTHMPNMFNPNMVYHPSQMMFGGQFPLQTEEIKLTVKNNTSGGTVTVTSPDMVLRDPFEGNQNIDVDEFLDTLNVENETGPNVVPTQNLGMQPMPPNLIPNSMPVHMNNISQTGPTVGYSISQPRIPISSQMVQGSTPVPVKSNLPSSCNYKSDFNGPNFRDPQTRRSSDPNDSGVESAGEASPYPESTPSPNGSTYTSPPSVDSGCGRSPKYGPFSPDSNSQCSVGGSPPKYTGMVTSPGMFSDAGSETSGYGSPGTPQAQTQGFTVGSPGPDVRTFPNKTTKASSKYIDENLDGLQDALKVICSSPGEDVLTYPNRITQEGSKYIDENLDGLQDALNVIAKDITDDAQRRASRKVDPQANHQKRPVNANNNNFQPPVSGKTQLPNGTLGKSFAPPMPPTTSGVTTIILPPQTQQPVNTSPLVLVPIQPVQPGNAPAPIMIVTNANQKAQPPKPKLREIRPKLSTGPSPDPNSVAVPNPAQTAAKNVKVQQQSNSQAIKQQQKTLNMARRNVAAVQRENLIQVDEEGDTYLHIAVVRTDRFMIQALLERLHREHLMNLVDKENNQRQTPLFLAVAINEPVKVQLLVKAGANVNTFAQNLSSDGQTTEVRAAIHVASVGGADFLRTLEELLKSADVSINIVNNYGQTALHCAILAHGKQKNGQGPINSIPIIQALIKKGADPSAQDKKSGKTPLMYAIEHRNLSLVETILNAVEPCKVKSVVKRQAFDGSSCLKIAEGIKRDFNDCEWNCLWDILQRAISSDVSRSQQVF